MPVLRALESASVIFYGQLVHRQYYQAHIKYTEALFNSKTLKRVQ
jgi:hypothetical protein